jgi:ferredoxin
MAQVEVAKRKCQAYGGCTKAAPDVFALGPDRKVEIIDPAGAPDEAILAAARSCPYRVITVTDETGRQLFPPPRK